jgi:hypothetical protein
LTNRRRREMGETRKLHGFDGYFDPKKWKNCMCETFSVGIFELVRLAGTDQFRRLPVKVRVKGSTYHPELVYAKAKEIVALLDAGTYRGPKTVRAF